MPSESAVFFREMSRTVMATDIFLACAIWLPAVLIVSLSM
ncbi:Uncharacterised protein [Mycobacteroides abscessus subsp. massiliense]|nr:Uncharacterised protein [Mycobacteroides abscessus subsp. massiliense]